MHFNATAYAITGGSDSNSNQTRGTCEEKVSRLLNWILEKCTTATFTFTFFSELWRPPIKRLDLPTDTTVISPPHHTA
ncbi:hypothetical protein Mapa_000193 [Marchantia paleacea]|nr:hypothetical protein Mapa_000193 [Marchantia paleacea]